MSIIKTKNQIRFLKDKGIFNVDVRNSEWFSLFRDEIRNSIAIEGIFTNKKELKSVIEKGAKTSSQKAAAILGYFEAAQYTYSYAENMIKDNEFKLKLSDIRQIHTLLMRYEKEYGYFNGLIGDFRKDSVEVTGANFKPLSSIYISDFLKIFVQWVNFNIENSSTENIIKFIASAHVLFETIHPFKDGNGRVGRILLGFLLIGMGFINITIKGSKKEDRSYYYNALEEGDDEFEKILRKFEKGENITVDNLNECMEKSNIDKMVKLIENGITKSINLLSKDYLLEKDVDKLLSLNEIGNITNMSPDYLRNLINREKIKGEKIKNKWHIKLKDIIEYMDKHNENR